MRVVVWLPGYCTNAGSSANIASVSTIVIRPLGEADIPAAHALSVRVFGPSAETEKYSLAAWQKHFYEGGLLVGAYQDGVLVGFKFGYVREPGGLHSWLGGVREESRRQGIMRALTTAQESCAREKGHAFITVNTYRDKFPRMYEFLLKSGYSVVGESGGEPKKTYFRKGL